MPLPESGNPISFEDINLELGNDADAELDLQSASVLLGESDAPYGMDELQGLSFNTFTYDTAGVYNFAVAGNGTVTAPVATIGTITSRVYSTGYNSSTNKYPQVTTDTTRTVTVTVQAPSTGYSNNGASVTGTESTLQPDTNFTFADTGVTSTDVVINASGTISVTIDEGTLNNTNPASFEPTDTETNDNSVTVTINVPAGYANTGGTVSQTFNNLTQPATPRTLSLTADDTLISGNDNSVVLTIEDVNWDNSGNETSWTVTETSGDLSNVAFNGASSATGTGDGTVNMSLSDNTSGTTRSGVITVSESGGNSDTVTITQTSYTPQPPTGVTISSLNTFPATSYSTQNVTGTVTGGLTPTAMSFVMPTTDFEFVQVDTTITVDNSTGTKLAEVNSNSLTSNGSFTVGVRPTADNTGTQNKSSSLVWSVANADGTVQPSTTVTQSYPVTWSVTPTTSTFSSNGGTNTVTLSTSLAWTATISGGFTFDLGATTKSGNAGTNNINVIKSSADLGATGTLTFSATGQSDLTVSLVQNAAPLDFDWFYGTVDQGSSTSKTITAPTSPASSYSIGLYAFRGSTAVATNWSLQRASASSWITLNTTSSGGLSTISATTTQNTNGTPYLYINVAANTSSSSRSGTVELSDSGNNIVVTLTISQAGTSGSGGGGDGGDGLDDPLT